MKKNSKLFDYFSLAFLPIVLSYLIRFVRCKRNEEE